ncbi:hypothetical protein A3H11_02400 [Candidatus Uhrbacteria bacterium RIFCSPLOWO2_12_FULL_47_10]|nr:MAG: hypothetical protein A3H11_02400 [Candidatus Uhrbacteria bacterium RIFCSPLOWO2_12_FULL_47_10]
MGYQKVGRWYLIRKVEFFPFDIFLVNAGYVRGKNSALRWRFRNTLFYYINGFEYSLRGVADLKGLKIFLEKNFNPHFVKQVGKAIRSAADDLLSITQNTFSSRANLEQNIDKFYQAWGTFCAVFQTPELAEMVGVQKNKHLIYRFGLDRDYAARQLAKLEPMYRLRLGPLLGIPVGDAMKLLPSEVQAVLLTKTFPKDFKQRKTCALLTLNGKTRVYCNREADRIFAKEFLRFQATDQFCEFKGQTVYSGKVKGKAYVAFNAEDFKRIPRGAILVCSMTRYTIVPYLKRVRAIVTDQGGVTCHAAIMARELKVPTVVGLKTATEQLKTGDRLEVDAEQGIVRRLA